MRRWVQLPLVFALGVVLAACGATPLGSDGDGSNGGGDGQGTDATAGPEESLVALHGGSIGLMPFVEVGSCFWVLAAAPDLTNVVELVTCDEEHQYEMFGKIEVPGDEWPGGEAMTEFVAGCEEDLFEDYVGTSADDSRWGILSVAPTEVEWAAGHHTIQCALFDLDSDTSEGSAADSGE